jgi:hypothetical protein
LISIKEARRLRARRLKLAEQDHYERTRHSLIVRETDPLTGRAVEIEKGHLRPTPETEAKLRADPITRMIANETLSQARGQAASEIEEVWSRLVAGLWARASDLSATKGGGGGPSDRIARLHAQHYLPWAVYLGGTPGRPAIDGTPPHPPGPGNCPLALVLAIDVIIDGASLAECCRARGLRNGSASDLLVYALAVYTDLAGWETNRDEIAAFEARLGRRRSGRPVLLDAPTARHQ